MELRSSYYRLKLILKLIVLMLIAQNIYAQNLASAQQKIDEIIVIVNGEPITSSLLTKKMRSMQSQMQRAGVVIPPQAELRKSALDSVVLETIILQLGREQQIDPEDEYVMSLVEANANKAGFSLDKFKANLQSENVVFAEYVKDVKRDVIINAVRERAVNSRLKITDAEIERFLRSPNTGYKQEFQVLHLVMNKKENSTVKEQDQIKQELNAIRVRALKGEDFATLVKKHSTSPDANKGGDLGFRVIDKFPEIYSLTMENTTVGDVSEVLESPIGFHVFKVIGARLETPKVPQIHARHILIKTGPNTTESQAFAEIKHIYNLITLNKERFAELAKKYGQDGTAEQGGDLGWAMPGDMVPEFEAVMAKTAVGDVSEPLKTAFGWHVLQVLDKQLRPVTRERMKNQAKMYIRQSRYDEVLNEWLREIQAKSHIEYKRFLE